uniref:Uncharacterized protein n=1 Tax=Monodelphis domestica TaxID=13616 RepID=A0A5F8G797_MONDO
ESGTSQSVSLEHEHFAASASSSSSSSSSPSSPATAAATDKDCRSKKNLRLAGKGTKELGSSSNEGMKPAVGRRKGLWVHLRKVFLWSLALYATIPFLVKLRPDLTFSSLRPSLLWHFLF